MMSNDTAAMLLGTTVRLESLGASGPLYGTGFVYEVRVHGGGTRTFLVSNRHQFHAASAGLILSLVRRGPDGQPAWGEALDIEVTDPRTKWFENPDGLDVAVMPLGSLAPANSILAISGDIAMTPAQEAACAAIETILTVGYPNRLFDPVNLTPIVRQGITATPIGLDYDGKPSFCIDAATFPGSSGSPVFCLRDIPPGSQPRFGILGRRVALAGLVTEFHARCVPGDLRRVEASSVVEIEVHESMHLGIALKARAIDDCVDLALKSAGLRRAIARRVDLLGERSA